MNPRLVLDLDAATGQIFASGTNSGGTTYDRSQPLFNLDLSGAVDKAHLDGSRTISGMVASVGTTEQAFPANYPAGSGPERDPDTFGSFSLTVANAGPAGEQGAAGATGPTGATGPAGAGRSQGHTRPEGRHAEGALHDQAPQERPRAGHLQAGQGIGQGEPDRGTGAPTRAAPSSAAG